MKKIFLILAAFCCFSANAQNVGNEFESEVFYNTTCLEINMKNSPLTELPKSAFYKSKCKTINFPRTITTIPEKAFQWSDIDILSQSSITRIEGAAFYGSKVRAFTFTNVTYIGDNAFYGCTSLDPPVCITLPISAEVHLKTVAI